MAIKKLQNDFTTPEQAKRLLELGVPADSADCFYDKHFFGGNIVQTRMYREWSKRHDLFSGIFRDIITPCWSVGRLIEIYELCYAQEYIRDAGTPLMEDVLSAIYDAINDTTEQWDFSKLED